MAFKTDSQGHTISSWCKPSKESANKAFCFVCHKTVCCNNQGLNQLLQHAKTQTHKKLADSIISGKQLVLTSDTSKDSSFTNKASSFNNKMTCFSYRMNLFELIWSLEVVSSHYSYASCDNIKDTFHAMFPGKISDDFSMSSSKVSYMVSEGTGPYLKKIVIDDVLNSQSMFTLHYDETTNAQIQKQLDIKIRFWSMSQGKL